MTDNIITLDELKSAIKLGKEVTKLGYVEHKPQNDMQWIEKYTELKMIQEFLLSNDPKVFAKLRPIQNE